MFITLSALTATSTKSSDIQRKDMDFQKKLNESEEQFLWRIGQAKDNGLTDLSWDEIADIVNRQFREDESEYRTAAAYRKPYQQAKRFYESGVFNVGEDDRVAEMQETLHEIRKEKQRLSDERTAINRMARSDGRFEENLEILAKMIRENGRTIFPEIHYDIEQSGNDLFIGLSDLHLGSDTKNNFGCYNSAVAEARLTEYLRRIIEIQKVHKAQDAYVGLMGDMINGEIHITTQLENRENVTEQVQKAAELISAFVYELSKHFRNVYVNSVAGNHSRTGLKDQVLRGNRLDNLIPWYMKAKLEHLSNVYFCDELNHDTTIGCFVIRGHRYLIVHGDYDGFNESGVSKLVMMLGYKPTAIMYGHMHRCSYDDIGGVKIIRSGSFNGVSDDYLVSRRITGKPQQMVCVLNDAGVSSCYPVELN